MTTRVIFCPARVIHGFKNGKRALSSSAEKYARNAQCWVGSLGRPLGRYKRQQRGFGTLTNASPAGIASKPLRT